MLEFVMPVLEAKNVHGLGKRPAMTKTRPNFPAAGFHR
jgi:hypothetical protein